MATIALTQDKVALVNDTDYEMLNKVKWCYFAKRNHTGYAVRGVRSGYTVKLVFMHNLIMGTKGIDHIDGNGLNNQRANLRIATKSQNAANTRVSAHKTHKSKSLYKGVSWHVASNKWHAQIGFEGSPQNLGLFTSEVEAAKAYNAAALEYFGEFARLNIIP
jgi:hypothetical protein